jgi:hypothetical protein
MRVQADTDDLTVDLAVPAGSATARKAGDHVLVGPRSMAVLTGPRPKTR